MTTFRYLLVAFLALVFGLGNLARQAQRSAGEARAEQLAAELTEMAAAIEGAPPPTMYRPYPPIEQATAQPVQPEPVQADSKAATKDITFDTIKFDIKKGQKFKRSMLTPEIEALKNQKIRIRGYMLPTYQQSGIEKFVLVRDDQECCFGPGAMIYDCVMVEMAAGKTTSFSSLPIAVEGTFDIKPVDGDDGDLWVLFQLRGDRAN